MAEATEEGISANEFASRAMAHFPELAEEPQRFDEGPAVEVVEDGVTDPVTPEANADERGEQPRDEKGRFAKAEEEGEQPEPEAAAEAETAEEVEEKLFAGKYKSEEDLEKAYLEAERRLGEMRNEVGTSRQAVEAMQAQMDQRFRELSEQLNRPPVMPVTQEMIENDPGSAAQQALVNGDYETLVEAVSVWKEDEPFEAALFWSGLQNEYRMDQMRAAQAAPAEPAQAAPQPTPQASDNEVDAEVAKVLQRNPDLEQFLPAIGEIARERPYLRDALEQGTPQSRASALEDLYALAKSRHVADTSAQAKEQAALEVAQRARDARSEATVISAKRGSSAAETKEDRVLNFRQAFRQHTGLPDLEVE